MVSQVTTGLYNETFAKYMASGKYNYQIFMTGVKCLHHLIEPYFDRTNSLTNSKEPSNIDKPIRQLKF